MPVRSSSTRTAGVGLSCVVGIAGELTGLSLAKDTPRPFRRAAWSSGSREFEVSPREPRVCGRLRTSHLRHDDGIVALERQVLAHVAAVDDLLEGERDPPLAACV